LGMLVVSNTDTFALHSVANLFVEASVGEAPCGLGDIDTGNSTGLRTQLKIARGSAPVHFKQCFMGFKRWEATFKVD